MRRTPMTATLRWSFYFHPNISPSRQQPFRPRRGTFKTYLSLEANQANHRCSTSYPRSVLGPKWSFCNHRPRLYYRAWINTSHPTSRKGVILAKDFEFFREAWPPTLSSFHFPLRSKERRDNGEVLAGTPFVPSCTIVRYMAVYRSNDAVRNLSPTYMMPVPKLSKRSSVPLSNVRMALGDSSDDTQPRKKRKKKERELKVKYFMQGPTRDGRELAVLRARWPL
ncbi:hypothetical protein F4804DRAFT_124111 [Jackrogersella minutella]|nr:hypothetical protein F4804DRAFT_124111 [Jackrogersella minutella]